MRSSTRSRPPGIVRLGARRRRVVQVQRSYGAELLRRDEKSLDHGSQSCSNQQRIESQTGCEPLRGSQPQQPAHVLGREDPLEV
jgi:hypothetical protein